MMVRKLNELEALLGRIWSGELKHSQAEFYTNDSFYDSDAVDCNTAACVCGWDYAIDMHKGNTSKACDSMYENNEMGLPWKYSEKKYQLNDALATLLFSSFSTKGLQQATIKSLRAKRKLGRCFPFEIYSTSYDAGLVLLRNEEVSDQTILTLMAFLDCKIETSQNNTFLVLPFETLAPIALPNLPKE
jgi:hypothetical protein